MKYRKKPVVIDAIQLGRSPQSLYDVLEFIGSTNAEPVQDEDLESHAVAIQTLSGERWLVRIGDWVILNSDNELSTSQDASFRHFYEEVTEE